MLGTADLVDGLEAVLERFLRSVEELRLVGGAGGSALSAGAVVGDDHDQGVVELAELLQEVKQAADVVVSVAEEAGEDLHHAGRQSPRVR